MNIRKGTFKDFEALKWAWNDNNITLDHIKSRVSQGTQEFLVVENGEEIVGEIHILWESNDRDEADGRNRAYILAYRIHPDFRGQGLGKQLMEEAFYEIRQKGFREVSLGVAREYRDRFPKSVWTFAKSTVRVMVPRKSSNSVSKEHAENLVNMYYKWGFDELVKTKSNDDHDFDKQGRAKKAKVELYRKVLKQS